MYIRITGSVPCIACDWRLTLNEEIEKEDIDYVVDNLKEIVAHLREMSPLYEDFIKKQK